MRVTPPKDIYLTSLIEGQKDTVRFLGMQDKKVWVEHLDGTRGWVGRDTFLILFTLSRNTTEKMTGISDRVPLFFEVFLGSFEIIYYICNVKMDILT